MAVGPSVHTVPFSFAPDVLPDVCVVVCELVTALPMPQAVLPFSLVLVPAAPDVLAEPVRLVVSPLSDVLIVRDP